LAWVSQRVRGVQAIKSTSFKVLVIASLCAVVAAVAVGAIGLDVMRRAEGMQLADTSAQAIVSAAPGAHVRAVVRVDAPAGTGTYTVEVLQNVQSAEYRATGARIRLALSSGTRFIMGMSPDVRPGAVVEVDGAMDAGATLRAAKIVILDGYVHVTR
jgi:hypothetical protein